MSTIRESQRQIKAVEATQVSQGPITPTSIEANEGPITQLELSRLRAMRDAGREANRLGAVLVRRIESGGRVEEGPITVKLQKCHGPRLKESNLTAAMGEKKVEKLKQDLTGAPRNRLLFNRD